jgi:hypothetical protein
LLTKYFRRVKIFIDENQRCSFNDFKGSDQSNSPTIAAAWADVFFAPKLQMLGVLQALFYSPQRYLVNGNLFQTQAFFDHSQSLKFRIREIRWRRFGMVALHNVGMQRVNLTPVQTHDRARERPGRRWPSRLPSKQATAIAQPKRLRLIQNAHRIEQINRAQRIAPVLA